jgi:hypothetical protein
MRSSEIAMRFDWRYYLLWIAYTGLLAGGLLFLTAQAIRVLFGENVLLLSLPILMGLFAGQTQWLVLRRRLAVSAWWVVLTAVGFAQGLLLGFLFLSVGLRGPTLGPLAAMLLMGAVVGAAQALLLRTAMLDFWWIVWSSALALGCAGLVGGESGALILIPVTYPLVGGLFVAYYVQEKGR